MSPTVEIISVWYNEEFLAPYFLKHYDWVDLITIFYDQDSTDGTLDLISKHPKVRVIPFRFPDMFDDDIKIKMMNKRLLSSECDWVFGLDADEFIFYKDEQGDFVYDLRPFLEAIPSGFNSILVKFQSVFRNIREGNLDPLAPAVPQRRHGVDVGPWVTKAAILRNNTELAWAAGCHHLERGSTLNILRDILVRKMGFPGRRRRVVRQCPELLLTAAHWNMVDPDFAVNRQVYNRKNRLSKHSIERKHGSHYSRCTEESVLAFCREHERDPQLF